MEENQDINTNQNNEILDDINYLEEIDDDDEKNDDLIQDMIKQGKYFDVIKYLESKDNKGKNKINLDNNNDDYMINNEEELVIIHADDISDLHEDNYEIKNWGRKWRK